MSVFLLCERAVGLVKGERLILDANGRAMLEALNYEGLTAAHAQDEAVACARHFRFVRDRLLQLWPWTFARKSASLSSTTREQGWSYAYTLPGDCLNVLAVLSGGEPVEWEAAAGKLLCGSSSVTIRYTARMEDTDAWDPAFADAFCAALASEMSIAVTGGVDAAGLLEQKAQLAIDRAWQMGVIQPETRIPVTDALCQRAIGLIRGVRLSLSTSEAAQKGGLDYTGMLNVRPQEENMACKRAFDAVRDRLLQLYPWVFARKTAAPAQLSASAGGWLYAFTLPGDCLSVLAVTARNRDGSFREWPLELAEWEIAGGQVLTNRTPVYIRYTARITDTSQWGPAFTDAFVASLASEAAMAVTGDARISQALEQKAAQVIQNGWETGVIKAETSLPKRHTPRVLHGGWDEYSGFPGHPDHNHPRPGLWGHWEHWEE